MILLRLFLEVFTADSLKKNTPYVTRKRALYENCRLLAPDNELLSLIDTRKANWYFERDLAGCNNNRHLLFIRITKLFY